MSKPVVQQASLFDESVKLSSSLSRWPPESLDLDDGWKLLVTEFLSSPAGLGLTDRLVKALSAGKTIFPPEPFRALSLTPLDQVRVLILGQDPYHQPGQAEGLAFSVAPGVRIPPSLRNIFKELAHSLGIPASDHGSLVRWAEQGVLLLNTCLTVEAGEAASHAGWGWEHLTDTLVTAVAKSERPVVFMLWGAQAQAKKHLIESIDLTGKHLVLQANHPSPLSAMRPPLPFLGCGHFAKLGEFWNQTGQKHIKW